MSIFRDVDFGPGGSLGIDYHVVNHPGTILKTNPDPPIPEWQKMGGSWRGFQQTLDFGVQGPPGEGDFRFFEVRF